MRNGSNTLKNLDWVTIMLFLVLAVIGWVSVYAAVYQEEHRSIFDISQSYGKQLLWIASAFVIAMIILIIDAKFFSAFAYLIYFLIMLMLITVLAIGTEISGSKSWFQIGGFSVQPAEFAKFATCLALAKYLSRMDMDIRKFSTWFVSGLIIILPVALVLLQYDTGSALVFIILVLVLFREGLSPVILIGGLAAIILFVLALVVSNMVIILFIVANVALVYWLFRELRSKWLRLSGIGLLAILYVLSVDYVFDNVLEAHQKTRINVLLGKEIDLKGAGYNLHQSKIAIGSGGFSGKGFLKGTQTKYNFVPEQSTDFIFCTIGEEWGFLGSFIVIGLFVGLLSRIIYLAERQRSSFSRIYGYGVASIIFFHFAVNIGMTIGLFPVIGIPLPFISYGGSSLWGFTILLFIFLRQDSVRLELL
ncbi:MAG: rod shape-determining protein RodA [Bacteroidales bacterium]